MKMFSSGSFAALGRTALPLPFAITPGMVIKNRSERGVVNVACWSNIYRRRLVVGGGLKLLGKLVLVGLSDVFGDVD
jgi:hypothetical protein